jgi:hypothetical protein
MTQFLNGIHHSEDIDVDERIILKWIIGKLVGSCEPESSGSG